jgi:hypothetical protein
MLEERNIGSKDFNFSLIFPPFHFSVIPSFHCAKWFLRHIALQIDWFLFIDMGSLISYHGHSGMPVKVVLVVLPAVIDEKVFFLVDQVHHLAGAGFEVRGQLNRQSRTRLLTEPSVDAPRKIDPEPLRVASPIFPFCRLHRNAADRADG